MYWELRDGTRLLIKDLTTDHLINIVNMLHREAQKKKDDHISRLLEECEYAWGPLDLKDIIKEIEKVEASPLTDYIFSRAIMAEWRRRGLDKGKPDPMTLLKELMR
jgi:hypothetical protein